MKSILRSFIFLLILSFTFSCHNKPNASKVEEQTSAEYFVNPLLPIGAEPWAMCYHSRYYYTQGCEDRIILWQTDDITDLANAEKKEVWKPTDMSYSFHLWGPKIHRVNDKWYIYFAADDGNMDNHHIYVIENSSENPFDGEFVFKGRIKTDMNDSWAIHANIFEFNDELYMIWSGWQTRRIETENQCIYIAKMDTPWSLKTERVLISKPEYEWERQWVNPDGSKTAYPIYVNEAPLFFQSKNKDKALIYYSASGNWTPYYAVGLLTANADLLNPASWTKKKEPVFQQNQEGKVFAPGNISFIPSPDGQETYFLYHARDIENEASGALDSRSPRMQKLDWDENGMPVFGIPLPINQKIKKPSGTKKNN